MLTLVMTYAICLGLVVSYAHGRFETPADYRFTARPGPYWWSYTGYVAWTVAVFLALCFGLSLPPVRDLLLSATVAPGLDKGVVQHLAAIPVPFAAALCVSVLLPKLSTLKGWDGAVLDWVRDKANIPGEVQELARRLTPEQLTLDGCQIDYLRAFIDREDRLPNALSDHLRCDKGMGYEQSQFRFTRVLCVYAHLKQLAAQPRYGRFFREREAEFDRIEAEFLAFATRSEALLTLAREVQGFDNRPEFSAEFGKVLAERREIYRAECTAAFEPLSKLTAYALLWGETTDEGVASRLRELGYDADIPPRTVFPVNELSLLAVALLVIFLLVGGPLAPFLFPVLPGGPPRSGSEAVGTFIVLVHGLTTLLTVRLVQRVPLFHRAPGGFPPVLPSLGWGLACAAGLWVLCQGFAWMMGAGPHAPFVWPITVLNAVLAGILAALCAGGLTLLVPERALRLAEAGLTGAAMAFTGWIVAWQTGLMAVCPADQYPRLLFATTLLPGMVGLLLGGFVPTIYRMAGTVRHALVPSM